MTENDKHMPETLTDEQVHERSLAGWQLLAKLISGEETCTVESVEIVER